MKKQQKLDHILNWNWNIVCSSTEDVGPYLCFGWGGLSNGTQTRKTLAEPLRRPTTRMAGSVAFSEAMEADEHTCQGFVIKREKMYPCI